MIFIVAATRADICVGNDQWSAVTLSGGQNKVFADRLMGRDSAGKILLRVETRERFNVKIRAAARAVSLVLDYCVERTVEWREQKKIETKQSAKKTSGPHNRWQPSQPYD